MAVTGNSNFKKCSAQGDIPWVDWCVLEAIRWNGYTTAAHVLVVSDGNGVEILRDTGGSTTGETREFCFGGVRVKGITITTMESGSVSIQGR